MATIIQNTIPDFECILKDLESQKENIVHISTFQPYGKKVDNITLMFDYGTNIKTRIVYHINPFHCEKLTLSDYDNQKHCFTSELKNEILNADNKKGFTQIVKFADRIADKADYYKKDLNGYLAQITH